MDEHIIRGLIQGVFVFAPIAIIGILLRKLWASPSEGARRLRIVLEVLGVLLLVGVILGSGANDRPFLIGIAVVIAVSIWVYRGFKK